MRRIKFRGKRVDNGEWVYGLLGRFLDRYVISDETETDFLIDPETVGQFTGLLDKNGKEIYEGDVVKIIGVHKSWESINCEVSFLFGSFMFKNISKLLGITLSQINEQFLKNGMDSCIGGPVNGNDIANCISCIGNRYDNPELLEAQ